MDKLTQLLEIEAKNISDSWQKASIEGKGTPQEIADRREGVIRSFFEKYFPFPYRVTKGQIVDSYGNSSQSIDCVILNPIHPYTYDKQNNCYSVLLADGVNFAIEIKSDLGNDKELHGALKQIQSVKKLRKKPLLENNKTLENDLTIPSIIFADSSPKDNHKFLKKLLNIMPIIK